MSEARWVVRHERTAPVTYAEAKALFEQAREPDAGKPLPDMRNVRVLKVKGGFKFHYKGRQQQYHRDPSFDLFTVRRDGTFLFHVGTYHYMPDQALSALRGLTPTGYISNWRNYLTLLNPDHGPAPAKSTTIPEVESPRWVRKESPFRDTYDAKVAKYGGLEEWFEAYDRWSRAEEEANRVYQEWFNSKERHIFEGAACTREGVLFKRSIERHEARARARRRQEEAANREAKRRHERERRKKEREQEKGHAKAVKWAREAAGVEVAPTTAAWLFNRGITPNDDGTVTLVKATRPDFRSGWGADYTPGTTVEAADYEPHGGCGNGLHFSPTYAEARSWSQRGWEGKGGHPSIALLCKVDLATLVVIDGTKVKARSCHVIGPVPIDEANVTNQPLVTKADKAATQSAAERIADKMAKAARAAVENQETNA